MLGITGAFVRHWAGEYDRQNRGTRDEEDERAIREWLAHLPAPRYLDLEHFVRLGRWKSPRQTRAYKSNEEDLVKETTALAYQASNELLKLRILKALNGVDVAVASTILHFLRPDTFPIFDFHVRSSLKRAGKWRRGIDDASDEAWQEYVALMRGLSRRLGVSLRELDKALWTYDKSPVV